MAKSKSRSNSRKRQRSSNGSGSRGKRQRTSNGLIALMLPQRPQKNLSRSEIRSRDRRLNKERGYNYQDQQGLGFVPVKHNMTRRDSLQNLFNKRSQF